MNKKLFCNRQSTLLEEVWDWQNGALPNDQKRSCLDVEVKLMREPI